MKDERERAGGRRGSDSAGIVFDPRRTGIQTPAAFFAFEAFRISALILTLHHCFPHIEQ